MWTTTSAPKIKRQIRGCSGGEDASHITDMDGTCVRVEPVEVPFLPLLYGKSGQGFWELAQ